jgi:hypothetical protein
VRLATAALALALALTAAAAQGAPLFESYQSFCVKAAGDPAASITAASAAGWTPIPQAILQQLSGALAIDKTDGLMHSDGSGMNFMFVGLKKMPVGGLTVDVRFCAIATTSPVASGELSAPLASWAAVPANPAFGKNGQIGYVFLDEDGVHKPVANPGDDTAKAMVHAGRMRLAFVQESPGVNLLAFAVPSI